MMKYRQIIILGNGFDLAQHIPSSYTSFFHYRYKKYLNPCDSEVISKLIKHPVDGGNCIWDYIFTALHDLHDSPTSWTSVEHVIKNWVFGTSNASLDDAIKYWERSASEDLEGIWPKSLIDAYDAMQIHIKNKISNIDFGILNPSGNAKYLDLSRHEIENIKDKLKRKILDLSFKEIHIIEDCFAKYLSDAIKNEPLYLYTSRYLYQTIAQSGSNTPIKNQRNAIISFNYTTPLLHTPKEKSIICQRNIHGNLDQFNLSTTNTYHLIFGIDGQGYSNQPKEVYQFTKTARVLNLHQQNTPDNNCSMFDFLRNKHPIDEVKFFGHSLSDADYSYFQSIFDHINLYAGTTKLTFYGTKRHPADPDAVIQLITKYGTTITPAAHGKNLLHKLLIEERIKIEEINTL
ncbi:hypothetical protein COO72_07805 [Bifidobacterium callitrichos]|nr:hypothetical protein COO72_07805 [Bifidobacterium callitrichos]